MFFLLASLLLVTVLFHELYWKRRRYPPGPTPLPLVGNSLGLLRHEPGYEEFIRCRREYGPVYTFWLSALPAVMIADYDVMKTHIVRDGDSFADRFNFEEFTNIFRGGIFGVIDSSGDQWREQRRFTLHVMRDFGMGRNIMQQRIMDEVVGMLDELRKVAQTGEPINIHGCFEQAVGSVINSILFGYRFEGERLTEFIDIKRTLTAHMKLAAHPATTFLLLWPSLRVLPYLSNLYATIMANRNTFYDFFRRQIAEHEKQLKAELLEANNNSGDDGQETPVGDDFVERYLREMYKRGDREKLEGFSMIQLENVCLDLWIAGMETTANTLSWAVVYLLNNPEVQARMHAELSEKIGSDRNIVEADKSSLPYCQAVINETQRLANLLPMNLMRKSPEDMKIGGHFVPKGTLIVPQISCVLYDEKLFPEPYAFRPERFLSPDLKTLVKCEELVPFSLGKRQCLGEALARAELFLFLSNVVNQFEILPEKVGHPPSSRKSFGITMCPEPFQVRLKPRW